MYLTINSKFKPFTYEDFAAPLREYGAAYKEMEEQYSDLVSQTETWKNIATQENSPRAYAIYKKYSDELKEASEDFSRGMNLKNRSQLIGLKTRKESEIGAIERASKAMDEANKYRDAMRAQDNTVVFSKERYTSLDDFLDGQIDDKSYVSGKQLEATAASRAQAASYNKFNELKSAGVSSNKAAQNIISGESGTNFRNSVIEDTMATMDLSSFDEEAKQRIRGYIALGVDTGIGSFASHEYITAAQRAQLEQSDRHHKASLGAQYAARAAQMRANGFDAQGYPIPGNKNYVFKTDDAGNYIKENGHYVVDEEATARLNAEDIEIPIPGANTTFTYGSHRFSEEDTSKATYNLLRFSLNPDNSSIIEHMSSNGLEDLLNNSEVANLWNVDIIRDEDDNIVQYKVYNNNGDTSIKVDRNAVRTD